MIPHIQSNIPAAGFEPTAPGTPEYEVGGFAPGADVVTEERVAQLVRLFLVTVPNMFKRPWLSAPEEDMKPFVTELTIYFNNNDIDPAEYFGEWFPVAMTGIPLGYGVIERHREHKKEHTGEKKEKFDSSPIIQEEHTPVEKKTSKYAATQGGDNLPEEEETELTKMEEEEYEEPIAEHNGCPGTDVTGPADDPESSIGIPGQFNH